LSTAALAESEAPAGCIGFLVLFLVPIMSIAAACAGLLDGAMLSLECERVAPRRVEEAVEQRGVVTVPYERVVAEGRVDARIVYKILGLFPIKRVYLADITSSDSTSTSHRVKDNRGRTSSSYTSGRLELTTRAGQTWKSAAISHALGQRAGEMRERIEEFLTSSGASPGSNLVGLPFALGVQMGGVKSKFFDISL